MNIDLEVLRPIGTSSRDHPTGYRCRRPHFEQTLEFARSAVALHHVYDRGRAGLG